jgi:ABC-type nitrate/sulfonate/bicarbonate transport system permease component
VLTRVVLPAASPQIVAGMRTSLALGVSLIAFAEMVASTDGIGYFTLQAQRTFAVADMWSGMLFLGLAGYVLNVAFRGFERRVLSWHRGMGEAR